MCPSYTYIFSVHILVWSTIYVLHIMRGKKYKLPESLANDTLPAGDQHEVNGQKSKEGDVGLGQGDACVELVG